MEIRNPYYGFYRAKVVSNRDEEFYGRIKVWIADIMPSISEDSGILALPANNPIGGRNSKEGNDNHYAGTCYIPIVGSYVWIFFESGNIQRPYYFAACDLHTSQVLPECRVGTNYEKKWVVFKSHEGRTITISDAEEDCRVEICGKKRLMSGGPAGDEDSVYEIDSNMNTILLDERSGKEKILIRTYKGDFFHVDIDEQKLQIYFKNGIEIKSDGDIKVSSSTNIDIKAGNNLNNEAGTDINIKAASAIKIEGNTIDIKSSGALKIESGATLDVKSGSGMNLEANGTMNIKANGSIKTQAMMSISNKAGSAVMIDAGAAASMLAGAVASVAGSGVAIMGGAPPGLSASSAGSASSATNATEANPEGERDT